MSPNPLLIRDATPADEDFLIGLTDRLAAFPLPAWRTAAEIAAADHPILRRALAHPNPDTLLQLAESSDGQRLGYVFATRQTDYFTQAACGHIEILAVSPAAEGHGVGRALMAAVDRWALARGFGHLTLHVFDTNDRARRLYQRLGYQPELIKYRKTGPVSDPEPHS